MDELGVGDCLLRLAELAAQIKAAGGDAYARPCDVGDNAAFEALVKGTAKEFGRLDVLVNNAGITRDGLIMRMRDDDWDQVMNVNLRSVFVACRAAARVMLKARSGRIINISSVVGLIAMVRIVIAAAATSLWAPSTEAPKANRASGKSTCRRPWSSRRPLRTC